MQKIKIWEAEACRYYSKPFEWKSSMKKKTQKRNKTES
jgi:hypothetical protein